MGHDHPAYSLQQHLQASCAREPAAPRLVALSGGLDSTALLHALAMLPTVRAAGLRAVHVHHGLQPQADAWAFHCERLCEGLSLRLDVVRTAVDRSGGLGIEAAARAARYAALEPLLASGEVLATAHHRDDQAETFLLRALRASGPDGLGAMRPWRDFGAGRHWRPLLEVPRAALLAYATAQALRWVEDPSNGDGDFDRNFLRLRVMPLLRERWPHADAAFARSAMLGAQASALLEADDLRDLAAVATVDPRVLSASALQSLDAPRAARVLRRWIGQLGHPPLPGQGVERIERDLLRARSDARARFAWSGVVVQRWRDLLHVDLQREALDADWCAAWDGARALPLPRGGELSLLGVDALPWPVRVHARRGGERIRLAGRTHSHALKQVLQDLGVPPWRRQRLPLVSRIEGELVAAGDLAYAAPLDAWLRERGACLRWTDGS
jgi:tRNA(Ile)-lysidine synthase